MIPGAYNIRILPACALNRIGGYGQRSSPFPVLRAPKPSLCSRPSVIRLYCAWKRSRREFPGIEIFGKAEYFNPGGSVKDRAALNMVLDGERSGKLNHNRTILDSTSGNTGIAYAMIGANRGYKVKLVLPGNASEERKRILKAYGAETVFSDPEREAPTAPSAWSARSTWKIPDRYFYPDQYNNPANWKAHFEGTGPEIIDQTNGGAHAFRLRDGNQRNLYRRHHAACAATCRK